MLAELAALGYRLADPAALSPAATAGLLARHEEILPVLAAMKGAGVDYVPLFGGFPADVPEDRDYFAHRVAGWLVRALGLTGPDAIPAELCDPAAFGADPVTQMQRADVFKSAAADQAGRAADGNVEWVTLTVAPRAEAEDAARAWLRAVLGGRASLAEAARPDVAALLTRFGAADLAPADVPFGETRALVSRALWDAGRLEEVRPFLSTPADVLKLCADLTDTDVALSRGVKFPRFTRAQRRCLLAALDACGERNDATLREGLKTHAGLWLELGRWLHPGEYETRFPRTFAAFDALRNGRIETWATRVEAALAAGDVTSLVPLLTERPGTFARRLHHALAIAGSDDRRVLAAFERIVD